MHVRLMVHIDIVL